MVEITYKQLEIITADVERANISFSHLQDDLIDHICCDLENEMDKGLSFEKAYEMVKKKIGFRGLQHVQEDTLLLIDKNYLIMKNTMKTFGVIAPILLAFSAVFKIQHWPGASVLLTLGFFLLCFVFLPSAIYVSYREVSNRKKLLSHLSGFAAGFLFSISFLFMVQHWPGARLLMLLGMLVACLFFIPSFFIGQLKNSSKIQKWIYIFGLLGSLAYLTGFYFKINRFDGAQILLVTGAIFLILVAFPLFVYSHYKQYEHVSSRFIFLTFAVIWLIVPTFLISLNVSEDALKGFRDNEAGKALTIQYLATKSNLLYSKIDAGTWTDSQKIKETAANVRKNADSLVEHIQRVKFKIVSLTNDEALNSNGEIVLKNIHNESGDAGQKMLFKEGEARNLKEKINGYSQFLMLQTGIDSTTIHLVADMLSTSPAAKNTPDVFKSWENYHLKSFTLITTLTKLTDLQRNVRASEYMVIKELAKKASAKRTVALLN
jgi:hypothetical protein